MHYFYSLDFSEIVAWVFRAIRKRKWANIINSYIASVCIRITPCTGMLIYTFLESSTMIMECSTGGSTSSNVSVLCITVFVFNVLFYTDSVETLTIKCCKSKCLSSIGKGESARVKLSIGAMCFKEQKSWLLTTFSTSYCVTAHAETQLPCPWPCSQLVFNY